MSGRPSSCGTGSPGCGGGWSAVTSAPGRRAGSPTGPSCCPGRRRRSWTPMWLRRRTRSARTSCTLWWRRRSPTTCPTSRKSGGWRRPTDATSPSSSKRLLRRHRECPRQLDLADAHDLEQAVADVAAQLKDLGSEESLDVRRAMAVGELARCQPTFDLDPTSVEPVKTPRRQVVLYVHLTDAALQGAAGTARLERGNAQVTAGQVRDWCGTAGQCGREAGDRPRHPRPRRVTGGAGQARRDRDPSRQDLRLPLVHQARATVRQGPLDPAQSRRSDVSVQSGAVVSAAPSDQDPRRLVVSDDRARHLPVDVEARVPVPPRHRRHPRRQPRSAPATRLATPPHTPPKGGAIPMPGHRVCAFSTATTAVDPSRPRADKQHK